MEKRHIYWPTTLFLIITPLVVLIALPLYFWYEQLPLSILWFALIYGAATNLSITAGYHRLMSHRAYEAHPIVRLIFLLIGASAWQGSALKWSSDHRIHHNKVDSKDDPYSISRGFWHAHMGWLFFKETVDLPIHAPDLERDPLIAWQNKFYMPLAIFMSFGVPTLFGLAVGAPWAGLLVAGAVRTILTQQSTFFVNSLSHTLGKKTYSTEISARDSILVAILTHGEGYHNFHHRFQSDYRNGIRWYHWDPTKWTILLLSWMGLARRLRRISEQEILRARLHVDSLRLKGRGFSEERLESLRSQVLSAQVALKKKRDEFRSMSQDLSRVSRETLESRRLEINLLRAELQFAMKKWRILLASAT